MIWYGSGFDGEEIRQILMRWVTNHPTMDDKPSFQYQCIVHYHQVFRRRAPSDDTSLKWKRRWKNKTKRELRMYNSSDWVLNREYNSLRLHHQSVVLLHCLIQNSSCLILFMLPPLRTSKHGILTKASQRFVSVIQDTNTRYKPLLSSKYLSFSIEQGIQLTSKINWCLLRHSQRATTDFVFRTQTS
jgi:hypothetical protein